MRTSRTLDFADEGQVGLAEDVLAHDHHPGARGLDVHGPPDQPHEPLPQGHDGGRDIRVLLAHRARMDARDEEAVELVEGDGVGPHEGEVEVARAGSVRVEGRAVAVATAGDGAAAQDGGRAVRYRRAQRVAELLEPARVAAEGEAHDVVAHLRLAQLHPPTNVPMPPAARLAVRRNGARRAQGRGYA